MRTIETLIILLNLIALLMLYIPLRSQHRWLRFLPVVVVSLTLVHLIVEQYHWQMVLSYLLTAALFVLSLPGLLKGAHNPPARGALGVVAGAFGFLWWLIAAALPIILPVPRLPTPPG